jgi:Flp pilus assembly pilin Flp
MSTAFRSFLRDERGGAISDYAVVTLVFALATIGTMQLLTNEASHQLVATQTNLTNNVVSPP